YRWPYRPLQAAFRWLQRQISAASRESLMGFSRLMKKASLVAPFLCLSFVGFGGLSGCLGDIEADSWMWRAIIALSSGAGLIALSGPKSWCCLFRRHAGSDAVSHCCVHATGC